MQLVLSNNRIIAHGENFLALGGVVINTDTGAKFDNATIAECECAPSDIGQVGYEYHAGVFVPCAPFGMGNNKGYVMEVCTECATPRNSGIAIKDLGEWETLAEITVNKQGNGTSTSVSETVSFGVDLASFYNITDVAVVVCAGTEFYRSESNADYYLQIDSECRIMSSGSFLGKSTLTTDKIIYSAHIAADYRPTAEGTISVDSISPNKFLSIKLSVDYDSYIKGNVLLKGRKI